MKALTVWLLFLGPALLLVLMVASLVGLLPVSLPVLALIGLGIEAGVLLWYHRRKLERLI